MRPNIFPTFPDALPVHSISPVDGWALYSAMQDDDDGFAAPAFVALNDGVEVVLDVSRFHFKPTQDRFAWLVRNGFPPRQTIGPWDNADIDMRMAVPALGEAA